MIARVSREAARDVNPASSIFRVSSLQFQEHHTSEVDWISVDGIHESIGGGSEIRPGQIHKRGP